MDQYKFLDLHGKSTIRVKMGYPGSNRLERWPCGKDSGRSRRDRTFSSGDRSVVTIPELGPWTDEWVC
ncbi:hypothetical protein WG66_005481 [Moniliophthora roreri]|nr:hypothetical protein WG66_005481 [Moniliophthora roreri]